MKAISGWSPALRNWRDGRDRPRDKAGLQKGDIVKAVDGTPIRSASQLRNLIGLDGSKLKAVNNRDRNFMPTHRRAVFVFT